jgi:hypothetical protein
VVKENYTSGHGVLLVVTVVSLVLVVVQVVLLMVSLNQ